MQAIGLVPLVQVGFSLEPQLRAGVLAIALSGNGDMAAIDPLAVYLKQVSAVVTDLSIAEVEFDFRQLFFLNSSCLKAFVTWIRDMTELRGQRFQVRFIANPKLYWQRRSLEALQRLAPNVVRIES
ncbi:MAG TPA: hypothetical protein VK745_11305 [Polyangiaceae bacterium]|jgi:hypothetical protein|nr:hypothetical protein [Polyangiaceae bacterium]